MATVWISTENFNSLVLNMQVYSDRFPDTFTVCLYDEQLPPSRPHRLDHLAFADGTRYLHKGKFGDIQVVRALVHVLSYFQLFVSSRLLGLNKWLTRRRMTYWLSARKRKKQKRERETTSDAMQRARSLYTHCGSHLVSSPLFRSVSQGRLSCASLLSLITTDNPNRWTPF